MKPETERKIAIVNAIMKELETTVFILSFSLLPAKRATMARLPA